MDAALPLLTVDAPDLDDVSAMTAATAAFLAMHWGSNAFTSWAPLGGYLAQAFALAVAAMDADSLVRKNLAPVLEAPADDPGVASLQAIMAALVGPVQSLTNNGPALSPCTVFILAAI